MQMTRAPLTGPLLPPPLACAPFIITATARLKPAQLQSSKVPCACAPALQQCPPWHLAPIAVAAAAGCCRHATSRLLHPPAKRWQLTANAAQEQQQHQVITLNRPHVHESADHPPPPQQRSADGGAAALLHRRVPAALDHHVCCVKHLRGRRTRPGSRVVWW